MKTAIIIHGTCEREEYFSADYPSLSNSHWIPWLQKQLLIAGYETQTPEMPQAYYPNYRSWSELLDKFTINNHSILIGHSCGAGFLLRYLSERKLNIKRVVLVAPWLDPNNEKDPEFFNFNLNECSKIETEWKILSSLNDSTDVIDSIRLIKNVLPEARLYEFPNHGHFCFSDLGTVEFLELRSLCL